MIKLDIKKFMKNKIIIFLSLYRINPTKFIIPLVDYHTNQKSTLFISDAKNVVIRKKILNSKNFTLEFINDSIYYKTF